MTEVTAARARRPLVLAIDVGTSSIRAGLFDAVGRSVRDSGARRSCTVRTSLDGGAELDPDELLAAVVGAVDEAMERAQGLAPAGVAMATFWHNLMGVDADGQPTTPLYLWADSRSREAMTELRRRLDEPAVHARTGCLLHWSYLPAKLTWLARARPEAFRRTSRWLSFGEYFTLRAFGRVACGLSMASGTGLLDLRTRQWDAELIAELPIDVEQLSPLVDLDQPFSGLTSPFAEHWAALRDVPWFPPLGDGATNNVGSGCLTRDRMALMIGTSGALRVAWRSEPVPLPAQAWCYRVDGRRLVVGGSLTNGGNLFAWMRRTLRLGRVGAVERELAAMEPDRHGLTVLPFLAGERSPGYAAHARGAILGLTLATRPIDILRAGMEAIALRFALLHQIVRPIAADDHQVVATGGALLRSPSWAQMMADALGRAVVSCNEPEASSRGAAMLALEALGALDNAEAVPLQRGRRFEPDPGRHERYLEAQQRHRGYYHQLVER